MVGQRCAGTAAARQRLEPVHHRQAFPAAPSAHQIGKMLRLREAAGLQALVCPTRICGLDSPPGDAAGRRIGRSGLRQTLPIGRSRAPCRQTSGICHQVPVQTVGGGARLRLPSLLRRRIRARPMRLFGECLAGRRMSVAHLGTRCAALCGVTVSWCERSRWSAWRMERPVVVLVQLALFSSAAWSPRLG